jgi:hypothetical protein
MVDLRWREPGSYKAARLRAGGAVKRGAIASILVATAIAGLFVLMSFRRPPAVGWPVLFAISAGCGVVSFVAGWLSSYAPSEVLFSEKGINRNGARGFGIHLEFWKWDSIVSCSLGITRLGARDFPVLRLHTHGGRILDEIGLGKQAGEFEIRASLARHQRQLTVENARKAQGTSRPG